MDLLNRNHSPSIALHAATVAAILGALAACAGPAVSPLATEPPESPMVTAPATSNANTRPPTPGPPSPGDGALSDLAQLLPETLGGTRLDRFSGTPADFGMGGDTCMVFCPGQLQRLAQLAGIHSEDVTWAMAVLQEPSDAAVLRIVRLPNAKKGLLDAWVDALKESGGYWSFFERSMAGRTVTIAIDPSRDDYDGVQYLVAIDDVLFVYSGQPVVNSADEDPIPVITEALSKIRT